MTDSNPPASSEQAPEPHAGGSSTAGLVAEGELTDEGKREVARWINEGMGLSEVQKTLAAEHGLNLTYMETRFLVDDLDLALQDPEEPEPKLPAAEEQGAAAEEGAADLDQSASTDASGISVEVDKVMRPGALASGSVTFSDGISTEWQLDQFGRLAVTPKDDHKPSEADLMAFQEQLQVELRKAGF
jgi:hypothetical protein